MPQWIGASGGFLPYCYAYVSTGPTVGAGASSTVDFDASLGEDWWDVSIPDSIVPGETGVFLVSAMMQAPPGQTGYVDLRIECDFAHPLSNFNEVGSAFATNADMNGDAVRQSVTGVMLSNDAANEFNIRFANRTDGSIGLSYCALSVVKLADL